MRIMEKITKFLRKGVPTFAAVAIFFIVSVLCYAPQFEGRVLPQHDVQQFDGMSRDIRECRAEYGEDPQWTGAMFGGMPAYLINIRYPAQIIKHTADRLLGVFAEPAGLLFWAMMAAWLMCIMMGMSAWVGIIVGLAYGLSTYFMLIIGAGHITKMWALIYAPAMIGAIYMTLRGRRWVGGALAALFASLEIGANHPQITYYFMLAVAALWINDLIFALREKHLPDFAKRTGILAVAAVLALGSNFAPLLYTAKHTKATTRGGSELVSAPDSKAARGLDLEYATAWSYGLAESWNMLIPDFAGGDSGASFSRDGKVADSLKDLGLSEVAAQLPTYWGGQPYTAGPTYLGAVAVMLALLGAILAPRRDKWWIVAVTLLAVLLAWGHNCMWFTEFCFKYLPLYNKFRTVSMSLVVVEWSVPLLAGIGLWQIWQKRDDADFRLHAHLAGCDFAVAAVARHVAVLFHAEVARAFSRRVVAEHIQRPFAGVQAVAAAFDFAVDGKFLADFVLHPAALHVAVHALVGDDLVVVHVVSPFTSSIWPARPAAQRFSRFSGSPASSPGMSCPAAACRGTGPRPCTPPAWRSFPGPGSARPAAPAALGILLFLAA